MIFKNGFWVQRVVTDGRCRVLINPTALLGACEIDIFAKFLLTLIYRKFTLERPCSSIGLAVTPFKKGHDHQKKRTQHVKRPENRPAREVVNKSSENTQADYQN